MADLVTQVAVEVLNSGGTARVTQTPVEVLVQHQPVTHIGVTQVAVEVLVPVSLSYVKEVIFVGPLLEP